VSRSKGYAYDGPRGLIQMHSSWEVKVARLFDSLRLTWTYEPELFRTSEGGYVPDFWVVEAQCYVEVKGYENSYVTRKLDAFAREFSQHELVVARDIGFVGMAYLAQRLYQLCLGIRLQRLTPDERIEMIRRNVLRAYTELTELLDATPWKWHRVYEDPCIDVQNLKEEFGDLFVFMLNVMAAAGLAESDIMEAVSFVHKKNFARLRDGINKRECGDGQDQDGDHRGR
jgi:hypothetical protein